MSRVQSVARLTLTLVGLTLPVAARAEGSAQTGTQELLSQTALFVDVIDPATEGIVFTGVGVVDAVDPEGTPIGRFESGESILPTSGLAGAYALQLSTSQAGDWDIAVSKGGRAQPGRLHSYAWAFDAGTYQADGAFDGSLYYIVPAGAGVQTGIVEVALEGVSGWDWRLGANETGVNDSEGRSVPSNLHTFVPTYPAYLNPPEVANRLSAVPRVGDLTMSYADNDCNGVVAGLAQGQFEFSTDTSGRYRIVCDINRDGTFDFVSDGDLTLSGEASVGVNRVVWTGLAADEAPVPAGSYACHVLITVGEIHAVADDMETAFPGIRLFELARDGAHRPLAMVWNDAAVQDASVTMPDDQVSLETSGPYGLSSGDYAEDALPNVNARAWGDFGEASKGDRALLDTFTWLQDVTSDEVEITVIDGDTDDCWDGSGDGGAADGGGEDIESTGGGYYRGGCVTGAGASGFGGVALALLGLLARRRRGGCA